MYSRRFFLKTMGLLLATTVAGCNAQNTSQRNGLDKNTTWFMPDEAAPHKRTWMAFSASTAIWGQKLAAGAKDNLATIAKTIAKYEPVLMLVNNEDYEIAQEKCGPTVELLKMPLNDLWMRDTGAVFVQDQNGRVGAIDFNFNGWGEKQAYQHDAQVAGFMAKNTQSTLLNSDLVLEGGSVEVDGQGTAIITESCVLNPNRNPGISKADCEAELKYLLGVRKIIWLPGLRGKDITDGHTDFYARFTAPGIVVAGLEMDPQFDDYKVTREHLKILESATDADGRQLEVVVIEGPQDIRPEYANDDFAAGYMNFYVANGAVIAPQFGDDAADAKAKETLEWLYPNRVIEQLNIDAIAAGGGGIHCTTQQELLK